MEPLPWHSSSETHSVERVDMSLQQQQNNVVVRPNHHQQQQQQQQQQQHKHATMVTNEELVQQQQHRMNLILAIIYNDPLAPNLKQPPELPNNDVIVHDLHDASTIIDLHTVQSTLESRGYTAFRHFIMDMTSIMDRGKSNPKTARAAEYLSHKFQRLCRIGGEFMDPSKEEQEAYDAWLAHSTSPLDPTENEAADAANAPAPGPFGEIARGSEDDERALLNSFDNERSFSPVSGTHFLETSHESHEENFENGVKGGNSKPRVDHMSSNTRLGLQVNVNLGREDQDKKLPANSNQSNSTIQMVEGALPQDIKALGGEIAVMFQNKFHYLQKSNNHDPLHNPIFDDIALTYWEINNYRKDIVRLNTAATYTADILRYAKQDHGIEFDSWSPEKNPHKPDEKSPLKASWTHWLYKREETTTALERRVRTLFEQYYVRDKKPVHRVNPEHIQPDRPFSKYLQYLITLGPGDTRPSFAEYFKLLQHPQLSSAEVAAAAYHAQPDESTGPQAEPVYSSNKRLRGISSPSSREELQLKEKAGDKVTKLYDLILKATDSANRLNDDLYNGRRSHWEYAIDVYIAKSRPQGSDSYNYGCILDERRWNCLRPVLIDPLKAWENEREKALGQEHGRDCKILENMLISTLNDHKIRQLLFPALSMNYVSCLIYMRDRENANLKRVGWPFGWPFYCEEDEESKAPDFQAHIEAHQQNGGSIGRGGSTFDKRLFRLLQNEALYTAEYADYSAYFKHFLRPMKRPYTADEVRAAFPQLSETLLGISESYVIKVCTLLDIAYETTELIESTEAVRTRFPGLSETHVVKVCVDLNVPYEPLEAMERSTEKVRATFRNLSETQVIKACLHLDITYVPMQPFFTVEKVRDEFPGLSETQLMRVCLDLNIDYEEPGAMMDR